MCSGQSISIEGMTANTLPDSQADGFKAPEQPTILLSRNTLLRCTECGTMEADYFYLRRQRGLYAVLCFREGKGCWEQSPRTLCSHTDGHGFQCQSLAEWEIVYGSEPISKRISCSEHLQYLAPSDHSAIHLYPLED